MKAIGTLDLILALPELVLLVGGCTLMLVDLFAPVRRGLVLRIALWTIAASAAAVGVVLWGTGGALVYAFHGHYVADLLAHLLKLGASGAMAAALTVSRRYLAERGLLRGELLLLALFALLGMHVAISAASLLVLYLGLELLTLCLVVLVALDRDSAQATEAAMKYFVLSALASGLLLYGMAMLYGATGTLLIPELAQRVTQLAAGAADRTFLVFGLVFIVSGLAFKVGVVPFHMWIPDVYQGAPTAVTLLIGTAPKLAAFAIAVRLLVNGLLELAADWQPMLALLAVLSLALGNLAAIAQTNLKRMLAYSTIAHMGFVLLGLLSGVVGGNWLNAADAYAAALFYVVVYVLMALAAFGMLVVLSARGLECEALDDVRGLNRRHPWLAFVLLLTMFSLAGVPPTVGFYAKLSVLSAAVAAGHVALAVFAVAMSLVGAFYYLRVVRLMYFEEPGPAQPARATEQVPAFVVSASGVALLALGLVPQPLVALCFAAIKSL